MLEIAVMDFAPPRSVYDMGQRKPGRPALGKPVNVRLPQGLLDALEEIAEAQADDLSSVIRQILNKHYPEHLHAAREIQAAKDAARKPKKGA